MHKLLPIRFYPVDVDSITPEATKDNLINAAEPYLAALEWNKNMLAANTRMGALKVLAKLSKPQWAMIYAGFLMTYVTSFPALPPGHLYELNVVLKDHVKSMADLAAGTPFPAGRVLKRRTGESYVE
jgi:hypothetical protein